MTPFIQRAVPVIALLTVMTRAETLDIDRTRSRIQIDAKATGHAFTGTLEDYTVIASGNDQTNAPTAFSLSWEFTELKTGEEKRDAEMIKWLGGGKPKGSFKFTKTWTDEKGQHHIMGPLTIRGVSKSISIPYTAQRDGNTITIDGKAGFDYQDFSLPIIRAMAVMTVNSQLTVRFHLVGRIK